LLDGAGKKAKHGNHRCMSEGPSTWVAVFTVVERGLDVAKIPKSNLAKPASGKRKKTNNLRQQRCFPTTT
jgi:hypothetical protein